MSFDFIKRYRELTKSKVALYGDEFIEQDLTDKNFNSAWLEGIKYYVPAIPAKEFSNTFKDKYAHLPMFSAATTYDTVYVLAKSLQDNPRDVSSYMATSEFKTITYGLITFDQVGGVISKNAAITVRQIVNGKGVEIK